MDPKLHIHKTTRISRSSEIDMEDSISVEEPLEIMIKYGPVDKRITKNLAITMRTPTSDEELIAGFLFSEGIIQRQADILNYTILPSKSQIGDIQLTVALVDLHPDIEIDLTDVDRNFFATSSCGVCGKTSMESICDDFNFPIKFGKPSIRRDVILGLKNTLDSQEGLFSVTGSLHSAVIVDCIGSFIYMAEDVGRHNALDKVIGHFLRNDKLPLIEHALVLSGRISFELVQKALRAGIPIIAALGAPSSAAIRLAQQYGVTLIGFLKDKHFNCYVDHGRISL